jgi:TonB-dependent starch-binding outer membrane protein SusC
MKTHLHFTQLKTLFVILFFVITGNALAQDQVVTGKVLDEQGTALPGVNILFKGSSEGTTTDANGNFTLRGNASNSTLVFSFIGYTTQELALNGQTSITVTLAPDVQQLGEVVVVGYGTQEKKDLTGSVSSVDAKDIQKVQVSGIDQALQGQVAGVQIATTGGAPGGNVNVLIRGVSSVTGDVQPLFVIDGFPVNNVGIGNPLNTINPSDIESVDVLKDASATAIYGSRGSNGVIIITTKRGKAGKPKIEFNAYEGLQDVPKTIEMMNAQQFAAFVIDSRNAGYVDNNPTRTILDDNATRAGGNYDVPEYLLDPNSPQNAWVVNPNLTTTDWQDAIFRTAPIRNYQLSASGGNDNLRYSVSGGYFKQDGVIIQSGLERFNAAMNIDGKLSEKLAFGISMLPSYTTQDDVPSAGHYGGFGIIGAALAFDPAIPVYNEDGTYGSSLPPAIASAGVPNPVKIANELKTRQNQFRYLSNAYLEYAIIKDLKLRSSFGVDLNYFNRNFWNPSTLNSGAETGPASANERNTQNTNWLSETTVSYQKDLEDHALNFVGGFTAQRNAFNQTEVTANNFSDDLVPSIGGGIINGGFQNITRTTLVSLLARVNYGFRDKYLLTATVRSDGSSRFGANNRWGTFPSASLGWRVSQENFLQNSKIISDLKLRVSYGLTGNNAIGDYRAISLLSAANYVQ